MVRHAAKHHLSGLDQLVEDYTVPIFVRHALIGGDPVQRGTGVFFRCGSEWLLVTASHVLEELFPEGRPVANGELVADALFPQREGKGRDPLVSVRGCSAFGFNDKRIDVGILRLPTGVGPLLGWRPVTLADIDFGAPKEGWYLLGGYPVSRATRGEGYFETVRQALMLPMCDLPAEEGNSKARIALHLDHNDGVDLKGNPLRHLTLEGVSGAPLWRVFDEGAKRFYPRLVAVQTGYYGLGHVWKVVGTHWGAVRAVICRAIPGLIETAEQIFVPS